MGFVALTKTVKDYNGHFILVYYRPQRSCGKVMFSQASVILFTGRGFVSQHALGQTPPDRHSLVDTPRPPTVTAADGTHPTGMHSCCKCVQAASLCKDKLITHPRKNAQNTLHCG